MCICPQLDEDDFKEEQNLVARLVHMLVNQDNDEMFKVRNYMFPVDDS